MLLLRPCSVAVLRHIKRSRSVVRRLNSGLKSPASVGGVGSLEIQYVCVMGYRAIAIDAGQGYRDDWGLPGVKVLMEMIQMLVVYWENMLV
jgi:hypothetical protein